MGTAVFVHLALMCNAKSDVEEDKEMFIVSSAPFVWNVSLHITQQCRDLHIDFLRGKS